MKMDEVDDNSSEISSFKLNEALNANVFYLNKKRKLQAAQLGLPIPKHKCWDPRLCPEPSSKYEENQEVEDLITHITKENEERRAIDEGSEPESFKDSNSFVGDSDSAMSVYGEAKFETEVSKIWSPDKPSTSSFIWGCNSVKETQYSSDDAAATRPPGQEESMFVEGERDHCHRYNDLQFPHNPKEPIVELESHLDQIYSELGTDNIEPCTDKELDDILYANAVNPNLYVLSSGRWSVNQDAQSATRKPTIDQEFEQYFSTLML